MTCFTVLVTRPQHQAAPLLAALSAAGMKPVHLPTVQIRPKTPSPASRHIIQHLNEYEIVLVISSNAAVYLVDLLDQYWPQIPVGIRFLAVGKATADRLLDLQVPVDYPEVHMTSEGLLDLPLLQSVKACKILIAKGCGGRQLLADTLINRGAFVQQLELYERVIPDYDEARCRQVFQQALHGIVITSVEILQNLLALAHEYVNTIKGLPLIVVSSRIAQFAEQQGFNKVINVQGTKPEYIVSALNHIRQQGIDS